MNNRVKDDIIEVLSKAVVYVDKKDFVSLKELSNHVIHNASIFQDADSIHIAVLVYVVSKIFDREKEIDPKIRDLIEESKNALSQNKFGDYNKSSKQLYDLLSKKDSKYKLYVEKVIEQAQLKKGMKVYDHGISLAQSARILNVSQWDLMALVGRTRVDDMFNDNSITVERLNFARKLFGLKVK